MQTAYILRGLPASGKTTWAKALIYNSLNKKFIKRVNKDELRTMFDNYIFSNKNEKFVNNIQEAAIKLVLEQGNNVIIDNTHITNESVKKLHETLSSLNIDLMVIEKCFNVALEECITKNSLRSGLSKVPETAITDMAKKLNNKKLEDKQTFYKKTIVEFDKSLPSAIICDLDGTLAIIGDRSPYDARDCDLKDFPNIPVVQCINAMHAAGMMIIFMSGRDEKYKSETVRFIDNTISSQIKYELHMRSYDDIRKDSIVKSELYFNNVHNKYDILFCLDDRNQICNFWRSIGLTCFQVAEGNF